MAELGKPRVREAIIASSDQAAAVGMMLQADLACPTRPDAGAYCSLVLDGRVSPLLLWEKHPASLVADGRCWRILLLLTDEAAAVRHTRPKIVVQQGSGDGSAAEAGR